MLNSDHEVGNSAAFSWHVAHTGSFGKSLGNLLSG